jgi:biopolymer transport protein ExbB/TolQ
MRRSVLFTLMLSILVTAYSTIELFRELSRIRLFGNGALYGGLSESLLPLVLGLLVCAVIYAVYSFYESALARRKAQWDRFCRDVGEKLRT